MIKLPTLIIQTESLGDKMKKVLLAVFLIFVLSLGLTSCVFTGEEYNVTLVYGNGDDSESFTVPTLGFFIRPEDPVRDNYVFCGWYTDEDGTRPYDFSSSVKRDTTLYAKWMPDYKEITNELMSEAISANVKLKVTHVKNVFGANNQYATGSAAIIKKSGNTCYALTNNHVVEAEGGALSTTVIAADVYGNEVLAEVLYKSAEYDLAIIRFEAKASLTALSIKAAAPEKNAPIITLGNPNGLINAVTYGNIVDYEAVSEDSQTTTSKVSFPVLWHTADMDHGSSGGALLDLDFNIIGINYAVSFDSEENFAYGFAVPAEKILEFLDIYF